MAITRDMARLVLDALVEGRDPVDVAADMDALRAFAVRDDRLIDAIRDFRKQNRAWLNARRSLGVGLGREVVGGEERFFVNAYLDRDLSAVSTDPALPNVLSFLSERMEVREKTIARPQPVGGAASVSERISNLNGEWGTLGCFVQKGDDAYVLSASHVIGNCGEARVGDQIVDGGMNPIASIVAKADVAVLQYSMPGNVVYHSTTDSAVAKLSPGLRPRNVIGGTALTPPQQPPSQALREGDRVTIYGSVTHGASAYVADTFCKTSSNQFCKPADDPSKVGFSGLVMTDAKIAVKYDSGAVVANDRHEIVGLVIMSSETSTWFHPIDRVLSDRSAELL